MEYAFLLFSVKCGSILVKALCYNWKVAGSIPDEEIFFFKLT
jgi:hypothetical protein